jgi:amino acid transporter
MVICLFCLQDETTIADHPSGLPFIGLAQQILGLQGAAVLVALFTIISIGQNVSVATTASRMTWGFARDGGFPWSSYFSHVDPAWKAPVRATWAQGIITALVGVLYLFSTTVLQAIVSVSSIALMISYGLPIATLLIVGRDKLNPGPFRLGKWGTTLNYVSVITCTVVSVFFFFPDTPKPSGSDMNYAIGVFGAMMFVSVTFWLVKGRHSYFRIE